MLPPICPEVHPLTATIALRLPTDKPGDKNASALHSSAEAFVASFERGGSWFLPM
jgi:hypothetical protein